MQDCPLLHACPKFCFQDCGPCEVRVTVRLPCGHEAGGVRCHSAQAPAKLQCAARVERTLSCGHQAFVRCGDASPVCAIPCGVALPSCGHPCHGTCGACNKVPGAAAEHKSCQRPCGAAMACGHSCAAACHRSAGAPCPPCRKACQISACGHSRCDKFCSAPCTPCADACSWAACAHVPSACPLPCGVSLRKGQGQGLKRRSLACKTIKI